MTPIIRLKKMSRKKTERVGETRYNAQGLRMRIIKYNGNKDVVIRFLETGEDRHVSYIRFKRGNIYANLFDYPVGNECTFTQAKWLTVGIVALIAVMLAGLLIYPAL